MSDGYSRGFAKTVSRALAVVASFEPDCKVNKLEKRVRTLLQRLAATLDYGKKPWDILIRDYADQVFENLFMSYSDRHWICHVDFAAVLSRSVSEFFPDDVQEEAFQGPFDRVIAESHDFAYRKHQYLTAVEQIISEEVKWPKVKKRVTRAVMTSLAKLPFPELNQALNVGQEHLSFWVSTTLRQLSDEGDGEPSSILPERAAAKLFARFLQERGDGDNEAPRKCDLGLLSRTVHEAYVCYGGIEARNQKEPAHGRRNRELATMPVHRRGSSQRWTGFDVSRALLLQPLNGMASRPSAAPRRPSQHFRHVFIMGPHHACTNALGRELVRYFDVKLRNGEFADSGVGRCHPALPVWKHRIFTPERPKEKYDGALWICLTKDPGFWLQSLKRQAPRSYYSVHPVETLRDGTDVYRYSPSGSGSWERPAPNDLYGKVEFDGVLFADALELWEATVSSYMDPQLYPPEQSVVLRCEDFLFRFDDTIAALEARGLKRRLLVPREPDPEPAKEHREMQCRGRDEALEFYADKAHRLKGLNAPVLRRLSELEAGSLCRALGYDSEEATSWNPSRHDAEERPRRPRPSTTEDQDLSRHDAEEQPQRLRPPRTEDQDLSRHDAEEQPQRPRPPRTEDQEPPPVPQEQDVDVQPQDPVRRQEPVPVERQDHVKLEEPPPAKRPRLGRWGPRRGFPMPIDGCQPEAQARSEPDTV